MSPDRCEREARAMALLLEHEMRATERSSETQAKSRARLGRHVERRSVDRATGVPMPSLYAIQT